MALGPYLDGNWSTPNQEGPYRVWQDSFTRSRLYAQKVRVLPASWAPVSWGASGPLGGFLVDETQPGIVGPFLEWERVFADVPAPFTRPEVLVYPLQLTITSSNGVDLAELPIGTLVQVNYSFYNTTSPWSTVPFTRATRYAKAGNSIYYIGSPLSPPGSLVQAEDTQITQWKGNIYQAKDIQVNLPKLIATS
jgi:hypothetical protein